MIPKSYSELMELPTFLDRFEYLRLGGKVGASTFGSQRYLNQMFYESDLWKDFRHDMIIRDEGCDLAFPGRELFGRIYVHHIIPITEEHIERRSGLLLDPENVVCTCFDTHQAIHYGDSTLLFPDPLERKPNDTCPWKGGTL